MGSSWDKPSGTKSLLSVQAIVTTEIAWAVLALLFFLLFSVPLPNQPRPIWYSLGTSIFELGAFSSAAWLCLRNWRSPQIVSGRNVWLGIGVGMACYFVGSLLFTLWETGWGREADVSPGDFFYILTYLFLGWGMVLAVASRRLNLEAWQWGAIVITAIVGIVAAIWISIPKDATAQLPALLPEPAVAQSPPASPKPKPSPKATQKPAAKPASKPAAQKPKPAASPAASPTPATSPAPIPAAPLAAPASKGEAAPAQAATQALLPVPDWVPALEQTLSPAKAGINLFYIVADVFLLIIAATLLVAFWGGRFSQSWRMIAAAAVSLYIADMWFKYATTQLPDYQSGGLLEVFWVFSGVLFGIGAALEYDLSRSRRSSSRRRA